MLKIALEGPYEIFDNIIGETISLWKNETKYRFLNANSSCYMSFASDTSCLVTSIMILNSEDVD